MPEKVVSPVSEKIIENWNSTKRILVILAHPDDPEFFCGGTIARWCAQGHEVQYCLLTRGQCGWKSQDLTPEQVGIHRMDEQRKAADILGVGEIDYLSYMDGELVPTLELRNDVIRLIRTQKPEIVVTSDPRTYFTSPNKLNHPDHRAAGSAVFDAVFPAAGNPRYIVKDATDQELAPHQVEELWLTLTQQGDTKIDVSSYFETRLRAIFEHRSQIRENTQDLRARLESRKVKDELSGDLMYIESFCRVQFV